MTDAVNRNLQTFASSKSLNVIKLFEFEEDDLAVALRKKGIFVESKKNERNDTAVG